GDFIQSLGAEIITTNQTAAAISIAVNSPQGGIGIAALRSINAGTTGGVVTVNAHGGENFDNDRERTTQITAFHSSLSGQFIGTAVNRFDTSVSVLTTDTAASNGNQNLVEENGLTELNLTAGNSGTIFLGLSAGTIQSADSATDITAAGATIVVPDKFGSAANPIRTSVNSLEVNTSAGGGGDQFIIEANGLTALNLNAGAANDVTLI